MRLVTSYINPDLDGVASGIIYATYLADRRAVAAFAGSLNAETTGVLAHLSIADDLELDRPGAADNDGVVLIDCHHPAQIPHIPDRSGVVLIIDHHPDGDAAAFPNALVQNEAVGAAATLVAERVAAAGSDGSLSRLASAHAALLACAIASNTLDFSAPSTTDRDRRMFAALAALADPDAALDALLSRMREWRQSFLSAPTTEAVHQDVKIVEGRFGPIAVAQLEGDGASRLLARPDLRQAVEGLADRPAVQYVLLSLVDTAAGTTTLITPDPLVRQALMALSPESVDDITLRLPFIALRKTHVIPALTAGYRPTSSYPGRISG
ncbi:DHH family phosphoesterase [Dactylosporangium roseum]|uniref:DHH family phosphoesterase n=1 Tax=Dactylosporangium roseum TaxID=47989 RepID=A0ABY5Z3F7_9ACTN|nr:DHH family phosphoesterase [Dactylosporangium roseum]UWZ36575.1 DHH family phosphoesterase [Dactylosporangium roseum]